MITHELAPIYIGKTYPASCADSLQAIIKNGGKVEHQIGSFSYTAGDVTIPLWHLGNLLRVGILVDVREKEDL